MSARISSLSPARSSLAAVALSLVACVALSLVACGEKAPPTPPAAAPPPPKPALVTAQGEALGSVIKVDVRCPPGRETSGCLQHAQAAIDEIKRVGQITDTWSNPDGDLGRINENAGGEPVTVSDDTARMLNAALTVSAASQGAFDVTVGALSGLWDIPGAELPDTETIQQRMELVDWTKVELDGNQVRLADEGMSVVLGGVVKGYAADQALAVIPEELDARLDVGTDFVVRGTWKVAVPVPGATPQIATFTVRDSALVTSGTWVPSGTPGEGYFKQVVDARTGEKADGAGVAVVAHPRGVIADALSTTLRVTGPDTSSVEVLGGWGMVFDEDSEPAEVGRRGAILLDVEVEELELPPAEEGEDAAEGTTEEASEEGEEPAEEAGTMAEPAEAPDSGE